MVCEHNQKVFTRCHLYSQFPKNAKPDIENPSGPWALNQSLRLLSASDERQEEREGDVSSAGGRGRKPPGPGPLWGSGAAAPARGRRSPRPQVQTGQVDTRIAPE